MKPLVLSLGLCLSIASGRVAWAVEEGTPTSGEASPPSMDFDFFADEAAPVKDAKAIELEKAGEKRRWMLQTHQILGITTWLAMGATVVVGQLNYNDQYGGGAGSGEWKGTHKTLAYSTAGLHLLTGTFALLAPKPFERPWQFDSALVHRIAAMGATAGMVTQVVFGILTRKQAGVGNPQSKDNARIHQVIGYSTFGLLTVAGTAWLF